MGRGSRRVRTRFGRRNERGAALVEAAIILPVVILVTFGAIEFGIGFSQKGGLQSVARAGARVGATLTGEDDPTPPGFPNNAKIGYDVATAVNAALGETTLPEVKALYVYRLSHNGSTWIPDGYSDSFDSACGTNCIKFTFNDATKQFDAGSPSGTWPGGAPTRNVCGAHPDRIGVSIHGKFHFLSGLVGVNPIELKETAIFQLEPTTC